MSPTTNLRGGGSTFWEDMLADRCMLFEGSEGLLRQRLFFQKKGRGR